MAIGNLIPDPPSRSLRIFAFDPAISAEFAMMGIGEIKIRIPWEENLQPGPIGEYVEVIDADPASERFYKPLDLNDPRLLAQNGLAPSDTNPQFHQQLVYAVAMATIGHFEQALGRVALWASHRERRSDGSLGRKQFVRRLRIYPHALRDRNAFYSPQKKALLFGYFPIESIDTASPEGTWVFTCLSHDIIAHETAHALLDAVHPRFNEPVNADVLAFHEAFADLVALFQRFSYPGVLADQIARTRGNLASENLLAQLAQQFGRASGRGHALRDALGELNRETKKWKPRTPNSRALDGIREPHDRGAILVAAVFGAFLKVYRSRTVDLYRIASEGTGVLREGDIHPDLSKRLADEAARCAQYVLQMCIRAIDYCPPVGITFGDYLRAIVTADYDLNPDDSSGYRLAFVESFRQWGIHPANMRSISVEGLLWPTGAVAEKEASIRLDPDEIRSLFTEDQLNPAQAGPARLQPWGLESDRYETWEGADLNTEVLKTWLMGKGRELLQAIGLVIESDDGQHSAPEDVPSSPTKKGPPPPINQRAPPKTVYRSDLDRVAVEVHSVRTALRRSARGSTVTDLVVEITQERHGYLDRRLQEIRDQKGVAGPEQAGDFIYRAGCTLLIDPGSMEVRRVIRTSGTIADNEQLSRVREFLTGGELEPANAFDPALKIFRAREPFALLHRGKGA